MKYYLSNKQFEKLLTLNKYQTQDFINQSSGTYISKEIEKVFFLYVYLDSKARYITELKVLNDGLFEFNYRKSYQSTSLSGILNIPDDFFKFLPEYIKNILKE